MSKGGRRAHTYSDLCHLQDGKNLAFFSSLLMTNQQVPTVLRVNPSNGAPLFSFLLSEFRIDGLERYSLPGVRSFQGISQPRCLRSNCLLLGSWHRLQDMMHDLCSYRCGGDYGPRPTPVLRLVINGGHSVLTTAYFFQWKSELSSTAYFFQWKSEL
jgi:hypothetical protein